MKLGLRSKVIVVIELVVLVVALSSSAVILTLQRKMLVDLTDRQLRSVSVLKEDDLKKYIDTAKENIGFFANNQRTHDILVHFLADKTEDTQREVEYILDEMSREKNAVSNSFLLDEKGVVVASTKSTDRGKTEDNEPFFLNAQKEVMTHDFYYDGVSEDPRLIVTAPIMGGDGVFSGVLVSEIRLEGVNAIMLEKSGLGTTGESFLVNSQGQVVTTLFKEPEISPQKTLLHLFQIERCLQGNSISGFLPDYHGDEVYGYWHWFPEIQSCLVTKIDRKEMLAPMTQITVSVVILIGVLSVVVGIFGYMFGQSIVRPLRQLHDLTMRMRGGDFTVKANIDSMDEIGEMGRAFNDMREYLNRYTISLETEVGNRTRELNEKILEGERSKSAILNILDDVGASEKQLKKHAEESRKFQQAVDASFDHMIITDADGVILHANHAAEVLTGYTKEEMIGLKPSLWGKQMSKSFYETLWQTIKVEKQGYSGEVTNKRKGGKLYLASIRVSSILDAAGEVKFFVGIERDITEERKVQRKIIRHADELEIANTHIEEQKDRAESILRFLKSIGEGVFATEISGNIIFINEAAQQMSRKFFANADGKNVSEIFSFVQELPDRSVMVSIVEQAFEQKQAVPFPQNTALIQDDGRKIPVAGTCSPIRDTQGDIIGVITVFRDVTKLRELDQMKNNFLSTAAHQLRTPLGSMRWSTELLMNGDFGRLPKAAKEVVHQIYDNNVRMVLLVNDLLDVSRIDSDKGREEKQPVNITILLQEIIQTMHAEAEKRSVQIVLTLPKEPLPLLLMPSKHLYEALENLVSNGIKYNRDGGILTLSVVMTATAILLTVADTGIGIPKEDTAKIFSKFFRSANAVLKETEGSGLGLSVVKSYLEESGATISFTSEENVGTTFLVEFPLDLKEQHL